MPPLRREAPWTGRSLAFLVFRQQFSELNAQFWGGVPEELLATRFFNQFESSTDFSKALGVDAAKWKSIANSVEEFEKKFDLHRQWSTLLTLILLTSCFERYISWIAKAAVISDPLLSPGFPKRVDGAMLLKYGHTIPVDIKGLTTGDWSSRVSRYKELFGFAPKQLIDSIGELERIRKMRNRIAHGFGVIEDRYIPIGTAVSVKLSEERLMKWFGVANTAADSIDRHLREKFVGDFETIELFNSWKTEPFALLKQSSIDVEKRYMNTPRGFEKFLGKYVSRSPGSEYCRSLDVFYRSL